MKKWMTTLVLAIICGATAVTSFLIHDLPQFYQWSMRYEQYEDHLEWLEKQAKRNHHGKNYPSTTMDSTANPNQILHKN